MSNIGVDRDPWSGLQTIQDEDELTEQLSSSSTQTFQSIAGPSDRPQIDNKGLSLSTSTVASSSFFNTSQPVDAPFLPDGGPDWSHLPSDFQHYLNWFDKNVTHYHYGINSDAEGIFTTMLLCIALQSESLLNALVSFSAYLATLQDPNGQLQDFLRFYNKSVALLLTSLEHKEKGNLATLLTILQLGTIEVRGAFDFTLANTLSN
jgi:hypothetical protein